MPPLGKKDGKDGAVDIPSVGTRGQCWRRDGSQGWGGSGEDPRAQSSILPAGSEGLRSHLKCWVDRADKQGDWIGPKPKRVTAPPEWSTSKQSR